jgi:hypothetical protein
MTAERAKEYTAMEMVNEVTVAFNEFRSNKKDGATFEYENAFAMNTQQDMVAVSAAVNIFLSQVLTAEYEVKLDGHTLPSDTFNFLPFVFMIHFRVVKAQKEKEISPPPEKTESDTITA